MKPELAVARTCRTYRDYLALGNDVREGPACRSVRCDPAPSIYEANHIQCITAASPEELDRLFAFQEEVLGDRDHRQMLIDPATPPAVTAALALRGYSPTPLLQLVLEGALQGPPPPAADLRLAESDEDWSHLHRLFRENHLEKDAKSGRPIYTEQVTAAMLTSKRRKAPPLRYFLAFVSDEAVAYFSAWPGAGGLGIVEDLFTRKSHRGRGIARALIHHCVDDARSRGAGDVLIGADPDDTPKHAYVAMGFRPVCLTWDWNWRPPLEC